MMKIDGYGDGEERDQDWEVSVIWEIKTLTQLRRIERTLISECHLRDWDSDCVTEIIYGLRFYLCKRSNKLIFLHSGRVWVWARGGYVYPCYPCFKIGKIPNPYPNSVKAGKTRIYDLCCHAYLLFIIFFDKNKRYSFIQIDRVHRYNTNPNSLKTKRMNLCTNSQHPC